MTMRVILAASMCAFACGAFAQTNPLPQHVQDEITLHRQRGYIGNCEIEKYGQFAICDQTNGGRRAYLDAKTAVASILSIGAERRNAQATRMCEIVLPGHSGHIFVGNVLRCH